MYVNSFLQSPSCSSYWRRGQVPFGPPDNGAIAVLGSSVGGRVFERQYCEERHQKMEC